jgi:hypothetical protein
LEPTPMPGCALVAAAHDVIHRSWILNEGLFFYSDPRPVATQASFLSFTF